MTANPSPAPTPGIRQWLKKFPLVRRLHERLRGGSSGTEVEDFIGEFFASSQDKTLVQIGANDGIMSDPFRRHLAEPGAYQAILVEPLPYYAGKLSALYEGRADVTVVHAAVGAEPGLQKIHYLPPAVADLMNGDGPRNDWAHGQGSFDRQSIVYWIEKNRFRGEAYCRQVPHFIESIACMDVRVMPARDILPRHGNLFLAIDVQGFELEVLKGVDWARPPAFVMYEDDVGENREISAYLGERGYRYVCGRTDRIFRLARPATRRDRGAAA